jgi:hypothetical protein
MVRKVGPADETVSSYEASLSSPPAEREREAKGKSPAARFLSWEIIKPKLENTNVIATTGPVEVAFYLEVNKPIHHGQHGIALFNNDGQLMWGTGTPADLDFEVGIHKIVYELPGLPLKPGYYHWYVTIFEEWIPIEQWYSFPELLIATAPLANRYYDEWAGFLNFPYGLNISKIA